MDTGWTQRPASAQFGGGIDPNVTAVTEAGLYRLLRHVGVLRGAVPPCDAPRMVTLMSIDHSLYAKSECLFDHMVSAGRSVKAEQLAGRMQHVTEPRRTSENVLFPVDGFVLAHTNRDYVRRGDFLMLIAQDTD
ncbi:MAG: succinylglutamate desuccinylase/aspartoacylase family protein [Burkholderiaceae bacterium]